MKHWLPLTIFSAPHLIDALSFQQDRCTAQRSLTRPLGFPHSSQYSSCTSLTRSRPVTRGSVGGYNSLRRPLAAPSPPAGMLSPPPLTDEARVTEAAERVDDETP